MLLIDVHELEQSLSLLALPSLYHGLSFPYWLCLKYQFEELKLNSILVYWNNFFIFIFSVRLLSVLRGHSVFSSPPQRPMTSEEFSIPDFIHYIFFPILILQKEPVLSLLILSSKQRNYLVPFVLRLWYEPGTSRTRSQHSTTRLSRRRWSLK